MEKDLSAAFQRIRDIPYSIPLSPDEPDCCCSGKVKEFKAWCDANDYEARYRVCAFRWSDLTLPPEVASVPHADDSTHVYLEVLLGEGWIDLDPTWDPGLAGILLVNEWDGIGNTRIAVPACSLFSLAESERVMAGSFDEEDFRVNGRFYCTINDWLAGCRVSAIGR